MQRDADSLFQADNVKLAAELIKHGSRADGRRLVDDGEGSGTRRVTIDILPDDTGATVAFGETRMHASVRAELQEPRQGSDGRLALDVRFSPMASAAFTVSTRHEAQAAQVSMLLQRAIVDGAAVDLEALTVQRGRLAWTLYLDIHILCHSGNLADCALLAAMAALAAFRLPQTDVSSAGELTVFEPEEREPLPLTIQHIPIAATFAVLADGDAIALDPTREELEAAEGAITILMSEHGELCGIHKVEGCAVSPDVVMRCVRLTLETAVRVAGVLREALKVHEIARVYTRVRRVAGAGDGGNVSGSTAAAAAKVAAARARVLPASSGTATMPRCTVTVASAVPASQLPNLKSLAVQDTQQQALEPLRRGKGDAVMQKQAAPTKLPQPDIASAGGGAEGAGDSGNGSDSDQDGSYHTGLGVRVGASASEPECSTRAPRAAEGGKEPASKMAGKKKGAGGAGRKRSSPTSGGQRCGDGDGFEDLAQRISGQAGPSGDPPKLADSIKPGRGRKKRKEGGSRN